jgi:hypothetical protein
MAEGETVSNGTLWDTGRPPSSNVVLPSMGALLGGPYNTLHTRGTTMEHVCKNLEHKDSSASGDSNKGSGTEAPQIGAAEQEQVNLEGREGSALGTSNKEPYRGSANGRSLDEQKRGGTSLIGREHLPSGSCILENLECLAEKVGTLGLQVTRRKCCGAAKKRARKVKLGEAPTGDSGSGQRRSAQGGQQHTSQAPSTSGTHQGGPGSAGLKSPKRRGPRKMAAVGWEYSRGWSDQEAQTGCATRLC